MEEEGIRDPFRYGSGAEPGSMENNMKKTNPIEGFCKLRQTVGLGKPDTQRRPVGFVLRCLLLAVGCVLGITAQAGAATQAQPAADVHVIQAPQGAIAPDVAVDSNGVVHMVYGLKNDAFYTRSSDNGKTWSAPVKMNGEVKVTTTMGERGPKLALGKAGAVCVVWLEFWAPGVQTHAWFTCSTDGGKSFEAPKAVSPMTGLDGVTLAADAAGGVACFWHCMNPVQKEIPQATWIHVARSADGGITFGDAAHVKISNLRELACSMCQMQARIGKDGSVYLVFRGADKNIRDFWMLKGAKGKDEFTALRVNEDNWEIKTCPMCGPELTVGPDGRALCAFMSRHKVYWAMSDQNVSAFQLHVATPAGEDDEIYPVAIANKKGQVLMAWQVGPMSTSGTATVKWAQYGRDGKPTGEAGVVGKSSSGTKAEVFVGTDDEFYIVTTAQ